MKTFVVAARSQNTNCFGLRGYIFVANDGTAVEAASGHKEHYEGDRVQVGGSGTTGDFSMAGYEIPYDRPKAPPNVVKEVWRVQPKTRTTCPKCKREVLAESIKDELCSSCQPLPKSDWDSLGFIMAYEDGELDSEEEMIEGFQKLIDCGLAFSLQGSYGRMAAQLIRTGACQDTHGVLA